VKWDAGALCALFASGCAAGQQPPATVATTTTPAATATATPTPPEPPRADGADALVGYQAQGDARSPTVARTIRFDVADLPLGTWGQPSRPHGFRVTPLPERGYKLWIESALFAEVTVANTRRALEFSAFTGGSFSMGIPPECGPGHIGHFPAHWAGIDPHSWSDDDIGVELGAGDFDVQGCRAGARVTVEARARAVVRGFAYAIRVRGESDDGEQLVMFLPHAAMVSTSGDPAFPLDQANTGPFTRLTLRLEPGAGQSAALRVSRAALHLWDELRSTRKAVWSYEDTSAPRDDLFVGIEVVQQGGTTMGTLRLALPEGKDRRYFERVLSAAGAA
jgi:hypothetical protein